MLNKIIDFRVPNLIENHEYEFRVAAVNAAGQGPWSSSSDAIVCRPPPCEYPTFLMYLLVHSESGSPAQVFDNNHSLPHKITMYRTCLYELI